MHELKAKLNIVDFSILFHFYWLRHLVFLAFSGEGVCFVFKQQWVYLHETLKAQ